MPTRPKPYKVLSNEKKSHRTKAELEMRKKGEEALASGKPFRERKEVKDDEIAHKEYKRINALLKGIEKNDALYEPVINRYCLMQAECITLEQEREYMMKMMADMKAEFSSLSEEMPRDEYAEYLIEFSKAMNSIYGKVMSLDKTIQTKRKMLLDIEKENAMTIASVLRAIPKKEEKQSNPLLEALKNG